MRILLSFFKKLSPDTLISIIIYILISNSVLFFLPEQIIGFGQRIILYSIHVVTNIIILFYFQSLSLRHSLFNENTYLPSWILILILSGNTVVYQLPFLNIILLAFVFIIDLILQMHGQKRNRNSLFILGVFAALFSIYNIGSALLIFWMLHAVYTMSSLSMKNLLTYFLTIFITALFVFSIAYLLDMDAILLEHIDSPFVQTHRFFNGYSIYYFLGLSILYFITNYLSNSNKQRSLSRSLLIVVLLVPVYWFLKIKGFEYVLWFAQIAMGIFISHLFQKDSRKKWILLLYLLLLIFILSNFIILLFG